MMDDFIRKHLPKEAKNAHQVLYDSKGELKFKPKPKEVAAMLKDYLALLRKEASRHGVELLALLEANELVLGMLGRAGKPAKSFTTDRLKAFLKDALKQVPGRFETYDAIKRCAGILKVMP